MHIANELEFFLRVLIGMSVRLSGLTAKGFHRPIPALAPEVDIRATLVVFAAGLTYLLHTFLRTSLGIADTSCPVLY